MSYTTARRCDPQARICAMPLTLLATESTLKRQRRKVQIIRSGLERDLVAFTSPGGSPGEAARATMES